MIWFDLDGVIRDLHLAVFGRDVEDWGYKINGLDLCDIIDKNLDLLLTAPSSAYLPVILDYRDRVGRLNILSSQPKLWREKTTAWIKQYLGTNSKAHLSIIYVDNSKDKFKYLNEGDLLIEDNPNYSDYSQIILIDHLYNKNVQPLSRVTHPKELKEILNECI